MRKKFIFLGSIFCLIALIGSFYFFSFTKRGIFAASTDNTIGWAWSENIGWISSNVFNDYNNDGTLDDHGSSSWNKTYNSGRNDQGRGVAIDSSGNIFVTGYTNNGSNNDYLTIKYDSTGATSTSFGTNGIQTYNSGGSDSGRGITVDSNNNVIVTGTASSNIYTAKYDNNSGGSVSGWPKTYDSGRVDNGMAVTTDSSNNVIVVGYTRNASNYDYIIIKYKSNGDLDTSFGTNGIITYDISGGDDYAMGVAVDSNNDIIVTGYVKNGSINDYYTIKYASSSTGSPLWEQRYHNSSNRTHYATGVDIDSNNNVFVAGYGYNGSNYDFRVIKYDINGTPDSVWGNDGKIYDSGQSDRAQGVAIDHDNDIIVTGYSTGNFFDYRTVKFTNTSGEITWNETYDGGDDDSPYGVAIDSSDNIVITGATKNANDDFYTIKYNLTSAGYGVGINIVYPSGDVTGYAWSENIGWIQYNPVGPYPSTPNYSVHYNFDTKELSGWAKILNSGDNGWIKFQGPPETAAPVYNLCRSCKGGGWTEVVSATDSSLDRLGYMSLYTDSQTTIMDDFGGGDVVVPNLRQRYVNTTSSGGDGTTSGTTGVHAAYSSLSAAMTAEADNLVADNVYLVVNCSGITADYTAVTVSGFTTDATHTITINGDNTTGKWNTGAYRLEVTSHGSVLDFGAGAEYSTVKNLQIKHTTDMAYGTVTTLNYSNFGSPYNFNVIGNIFYGVSDYSNSFRAMMPWTNSSILNIYNNIIYSSGTYGYVNGLWLGNDANIYNNTIYGLTNGTGIYRGNGVLTLDNNICYNNEIDYHVDHWSTVSGGHNLSKDDTSPDVSHRNKILTFVSTTSGSEDFHLVSSDTSAIDQGGDVYSTFTTDIDNTTRSETWDIGADEYAGTSGIISAGHGPNGTPVLDNFNRVNEGPPPSSNWGENGLKVFSNAVILDGTGSEQSSYWNNIYQNVEAYFTINQKPADGSKCGVGARYQAFGNGAYYFFELQARAGTDILYLGYWNGTSATELGTFAQEVSNGDSIAISVIGNTVKGYYKKLSGRTCDFCYENSAEGGNGRVGTQCTSCAGIICNTCTYTYRYGVSVLSYDLGSNGVKKSLEGWAYNDATIGWIHFNYAYANAHMPWAFDNFSANLTTVPPANTCKSVDLSWESSSWASSYEIWRDTGSSSSHDCSTASYYLSSGSDVVSICGDGSCDTQDSALNENTYYCFKVKAANDYDSIDCTNNTPDHPCPTQVKTPLCAPDDFTADGKTCGEINLSWTDKTGETNYKIYRSFRDTDATSSDTFITTLEANTITYKDETVIPGQKYYYLLTAGSASDDESPVAQTNGKTQCYKGPKYEEK